MGLKFNNIEEMIRYLDSKAVEHSQRVYETTLDHSEGSIQNVESNLAQLHEHYVLSESLAGIFGLAAFYGAYVGEVIRKIGSLRRVGKAMLPDGHFHHCAGGHETEEIPSCFQ
jgi:hypothetical protein